MTESYPQQPGRAPQPLPYGQPYPQAPEHPQGTVVLILGIVGIFLPVTAPFAWYLGSKGLREIRESGQAYSNESALNAGRVLGMVFTILTILAIVFVVIFVIVLTIAVVSQQPS